MDAALGIGTVFVAASDSAVRASDCPTLPTLENLPTGPPIRSHHVATRPKGRRILRRDLQELARAYSITRSWPGMNIFFSLRPGNTGAAAIAPKAKTNDTAISHQRTDTIMPISGIAVGIRNNAIHRSSA